MRSLARQPRQQQRHHADGRGHAQDTKHHVGGQEGNRLVEHAARSAGASS